MKEAKSITNCVIRVAKGCKGTAIDHLIKKMPNLIRGQKGYVLPLSLVTLAVGALVLVPFLQYVYTGIKSSEISKDLTLERYSAEAGIQDAISRLKVNMDGFTDSLTPDNPTASYSITVNGVEIFITVKIPETPEEPELDLPVQAGPHLHVGKKVSKSWIEPNVVNTLTYTIETTNYGTCTLHLGEIGDILPFPFQYVSGSSSGMTTADPTITWDNMQQVLTWSFTGDDRPTLYSGETGTQTFQANVIAGAGIYYNKASIKDDPEQAGEVSTGPTAAVAAGVYEIEAKTKCTVSQATAAIDSTEATILSWRNE